jgi:hypothetical protein
MDVSAEIAHGRTMAQTASFLCRGEDEVRETMKELGLEERAKKSPAGAGRSCGLE